MDPLTHLNTLIHEVVDLQHAASLLEWDEQVYMPPGGASTHGDMVATIRKIAHEKFTSDAVGRALDDARRSGAADGGESDNDKLLAVTAHEYDKAIRVPADFVAEQAQAVSAAQHAWAAARQQSDFAAFQPYLEKVIELKQRYVGFFPPGAHPYDVLLDDFEPSMTTAEVHELFGVLRPRQVALIRELTARPQVDDGFLHQHYSEAGMTEFARQVVTAIGFDWTRGRQDRSVHPFATGIGPNDVRITTRFVEREPLSLLFGLIHETGHALYEQGIAPAFARSLLGNAASLGVHESQSRLWENLVGRSRAFWDFFYPALQEQFPSQLGEVGLDQFYRGINRVNPTLIRVESDEATYNLHIMLRVEMEIGLLDGAIRAADLPELWRARMQEYLGVVPTTDATGVLQDIHWSIGAFGYFATYTLGNVISAQLWEAYRRAHPDRDDQIRRGDFAPLLDWLRTNIHQHGRKYKAQEMVQRAAGSRIDPQPYLEYLERKYRPIYGIDRAA
jgi:carboxypeptidase Taq